MRKLAALLFFGLVSAVGLIKLTRIDMDDGWGDLGSDWWDY